MPLQKTKLFNTNVTAIAADFLIFISYNYAVEMLMIRTINVEQALRPSQEGHETSLRYARCNQSMCCAARLIGRIPKYGSVSAYMRDMLHWLPIAQRISYRIAVLVWRCLLGSAPGYLCELCKPVDYLVYLDGEPFVPLLLVSSC